MENAARWLKDKERQQFTKLAPDDKRAFVETHIKKLIVKGKIMNLDSLPAYVGKDLKIIIKKASHVDTSVRFQNCHEFTRALYLHQNNSHDWWTDPDDDTVYAFCRKKEKYYRIVFRGRQMIVEASLNNIQWRKIFNASNTDVAIGHINTYIPNK